MSETRRGAIITMRIGGVCGKKSVGEIIHETQIDGSMDRWIDGSMDRTELNKLSPGMQD